MISVLDIGGEGRHQGAWNLNPSSVKTLGPGRGQPIPRLIDGKAEAIPLPDSSVEKIIMERSPLRDSAVHEIARVIAAHGTVELRHAAMPSFDPHSAARAILPGHVTQRHVQIGDQLLQETVFQLGSPAD